MENRKRITMATIKSYTDLSQSKTLSKILPIESADMRYGYTALYDYSDRMYDGGYDEIPYPKDFLIKNPNYTADEYDAELPCWSLSALLSVLPYGYSSILTKSFNGKDYYCKIDGKPFETEADNPVDACVAMIERLHELKML